MNAADTVTRDTQSIVVEYDLPYPPEKVWRALTEPELFARWLMPNDIKPEAGTALRFERRRCRAGTASFIARYWWLSRIGGCVIPGAAVRTG